MAERLYKCWECHQGGFKASELIAHRCPKCRGERSEATKESPKLATTPWVPRGQIGWVRFDGLGPDAGVYFRKRKRPITEAEGAKQIKVLKRIPTWKRNESR